MNCRNSVTYVQQKMNIPLRQLQFAKTYIDDIIVWSKFLTNHINYLRQLFCLLVKKNISLNLIKVFLKYSKITFLEQRVNVLKLTITKERLKTLTSLTISYTFAKLEVYLKLIDYIRQYIHFYAVIFRSLQNLKTTLFKAKIANSADIKRKAYISKTKLILTIKKENSFKTLQKAINKTEILIHFNFERILWIDLNESKKYKFNIMIFHFKKMFNDVISL